MGKSNLTSHPFTFSLLYNFSILSLTISSHKLEIDFLTNSSFPYNLISVNGISSERQFGKVYSREVRIRPHTDRCVKRHVSKNLIKVDKSDFIKKVKESKNFTFSKISSTLENKNIMI